MRSNNKFLTQSGNLLQTRRSWTWARRPQKDSVPTLQQDTCRKQKIRSENALITLERLQSSRYDLKTKETKSTDKAEQYSEAKDHYQMAVTEGVKLGNTREREGSSGQVWQEGLGPNLLRKCQWRNSNTTMLRPLRPTPIRNTHAQKPQEQLFGVAGGPHTSTNRDATQMSNRAQNTL